MILCTEVERSMEMQMHSHIYMYLAVSVGARTNCKKTQSRLTPQVHQLLQLKLGRA